MKKISLSVIIICLFANAGIAQTRSEIIKELAAIFKKMEGITIGSGSSQLKYITNRFTEKNVFVHVILKEDGTTTETKATSVNIHWDTMFDYEISTTAGAPEYMLTELKFYDDFDQTEVSNGKTKVSKTDSVELIIRKADKDKTEALLKKLYDMD